MWPMYVDLSDEECRGKLRDLELEAYAHVVSAFRAQGDLSKERRKMLQDLCSMLNVSVERHRAEIRRVVNDEHLNTIAERLAGPNTSTGWAVEGRRGVPMMARLCPQTVFSAVADTAANVQAAKNATLPLPGKTGVREIAIGIETMASRKRKEPPFEAPVSPNKVVALDSQYVSGLCPSENNPLVPESPLPQNSPPPPTPPPLPPAPQTSSADLDGGSQTETMTTMQHSSLPEQLPVKTTASILTGSTSASPAKHPAKQIMLKSASAVTTFGSFDQLNANLLTSKPSDSPITTVSHEELIPAVTDLSKISSDKNFQRSSPSITMKTPSIIPNPISSTSTTSASSDRIPVSSSPASSSMGNKFLTHIRCKSAGHTRQNLSLGLKLNTQQMNQKGLSPKSSQNLKVKQDNPSSFFTKKLSQTVFSSPSTESQNQHSLSSLTESTSATKSPISVSKSSLKTESSIVSNVQTSNKLTTVTKNFSRTSTPSTLARPLFSTTSKAGAKTLPPVIFNVSSTSGTSIQTTTKTTVSMASSEGSKPATPQLLPKSTAVGLTPSHLKISASNSSTIQYRNDGGVVRSARIVNISQPGSRLPCISPTTISALGLASNLSSSPLRVSLPAGTSASMNIRSAAAKPNVIVVHKAQMWPRAPGAAVIMSASAPIPKISNDESNSVPQKQDKSKLSGTELAPRPIAPAQSSSVSTATLKIPETSLLANPLANNKSSPSDNPAPSDNANAKLQENSTENQCKKNLLADVIQASGILETGADKATSLKDKSKDLKEEKAQNSSLESEAKSSKKNKASSVVDSASTTAQETNASKADLKKNITDTESTQTVEGERNGCSVMDGELHKQSKEVIEVPIQINESLSNTTENKSAVQVEVSEEKS